MKIVLDHRLFLSEEPTWVADLTELLLAANRSPHQLVLEGGQRGQRAFAGWVTNHHPSLQTSFMDIVARGRSPRYLRKPPAITVRVSNDIDEVIDEHGKSASARSSRAKALVQEPLKLWLENDESDAAFLRTIAPVGAFRDWLEHARDEEWIAFRHGSGSDLQNKLKALDPWERLRSWAMCDADTWEPDQRSSAVTTLEKVCGSHPAKARDVCAPTVPLRVLRRRAIENYLPMRALHHWANLRPQTA